MSEAVLGPKSAKYRVFWILRVYLENPGTPGKYLGIVPISSILPQILPQTSSQTQGNSRVSRGKLERNRMEHQTPSGFPGNFRKRKVLGTLWFPSGLPETLGQAKPTPQTRSLRRCCRWASGGPCYVEAQTRSRHSRAATRPRAHTRGSPNLGQGGPTRGSRPLTGRSLSSPSTARTTLDVRI